MSFSQITEPVHTDSYRDLRRLFDAVITGYIQAQERPIICSGHPHDPTDPLASHNRRKSTVDCEFICDVEHATEAVLKSPEEQRCWFRLAFDDENGLDPKLVKSVVCRCARTYKQRGLKPWTYYRHDRYPKRRPTE